MAQSDDRAGAGLSRDSPSRCMATIECVVGNLGMAWLSYSFVVGAGKPQ